MHSEAVQPDAFHKINDIPWCISISLIYVVSETFQIIQHSNSTKFCNFFGIGKPQLLVYAIRAKTLFLTPGKKDQPTLGMGDGMVGRGGNLGKEKNS